MRNGLNSLMTVVVVALIIAGLNAGSSALAKDEFRTWGDSKGKNKIKAKFVKLEDGNVTLENEDGDEIEIELKKLSPADQKYATDAAKGSDDSPFKSKGKSDDPFKPKTKSKTGAAKESMNDDSETARELPADASSAELVSMAGPEEWKVEVASTEVRTPAKTKPIPIPNKVDFFEGLKGMVFNHAKSKSVAVGFVIEPPGGKVRTRISVCELSGGKFGAPAESPGKMIPIALHDDGRQVLMKREDFGFGMADRLEVWIPKGKKVSKLFSWCPYGNESGTARDVAWAEFVDAEQLLTASKNGKVVLWKFPEIEAVWQIDTDGGVVPALSPDRKLLAFTTGSTTTTVGLFDIEKKEVIAQQAVPIKLQWPVFAFSPTGKRLACVAFDKVVVWDVATGNLERNIACHPGVNGACEFPDDNFVLAGGHFLVELENQLKLWTYEGGEQVHAVDGVTYFALTDGDKRPGALLPLQIPHSTARDLLKKALTDPSLFILKAGTQVRIDVNGIPDASQRERVANGLSKQLEAIGCKAGTTGTIDLVATIEGPKDIKINVSRVEYSTKEYTARVKLVYENQTAWESASTSAPGGIIFLAQGENVETHLKKREKPQYVFFDTVQLPKFLQKPAAGQAAGNSLTIGKSQVTTAGLR